MKWAVCQTPSPNIFADMMAPIIRQITCYLVPIVKWEQLPLLYLSFIKENTLKYKLKSMQFQFAILFFPYSLTASAPLYTKMIGFKKSAMRVQH